MRHFTGSPPLALFKVTSARCAPIFPAEGLSYRVAAYSTSIGPILQVLASKGTDFPAQHQTSQDATGT
jgi:hypothetical protein